MDSEISSRVEKVDQKREANKKQIDAIKESLKQKAGLESVI